MRFFKCVLLGYTQAGKTSLLRTYLNKRYCGDSEVTAYGLYSVQLPNGEGSILELKLWDTSGLVSNDNITRLYYPNTDVFLICFSIADSGQFENIPERWLSHIRLCCPNASIILVGTKMDLRENKDYLRKWNLKVITYEQGLQMAAKLGAFAYRECSALEENGVAEVFDALAWACNEQLFRTIYDSTPTKELESDLVKQKSKCSIM